MRIRVKTATLVMKKTAARDLSGSGWTKGDIGSLFGLSGQTIQGWLRELEGEVPGLEGKHYSIGETLAITGLPSSSLTDLILKKQVVVVRHRNRIWISAAEIESLKKRMRRKGPWSQESKRKLNSNGRTPLKSKGG